MVGASYAGYLLDMLRTLLALAGVCLLALYVLRLLARRGFGSGGQRPGDPVRVIGRVALDPRHSVHLVESGSRLFLIGVGEGAAPSLLAELDPETLAASGSSIVGPLPAKVAPAKVAPGDDEARDE